MEQFAVIAAATVVGFVCAGAATDAVAKGRCVMAGGAANMITEDLAKYMANAALKNSIAALNWKASGAVNMKCEPAAVGLTFCKATQKACG